MRMAASEQVQPHPLQAEVQHLFPHEFALSQRTLEYVRRQGMPIAESEAAAITRYEFY